MVKHVILWQFKDELSEERRKELKAEIKNGLENLQGVVPGLIEIKVQTEGLETSNAEFMLDSSFESPEALKGYSIHPAHVAVADTFVRPNTKTRLCLDFEV